MTPRAPSFLCQAIEVSSNTSPGGPLNKKLITVVIAVLALSTVGCAPSTTPEGEASSLAPISSAAAGETAPADDSATVGPPELKGVTRGTPSGWNEYEQAGFRFALPPEFSENPSHKTENGTLMVTYNSERPATPSISSRIVAFSWVDETNYSGEFPDSEQWFSFEVPGSEWRQVAVEQKPHEADSGDTEMFTFYTFQLGTDDRHAYQLQAYLPIDDTNETILAGIAGSLSID